MGFDELLQYSPFQFLAAETLECALQKIQQASSQCQKGLATIVKAVDAMLSQIRSDKFTQTKQHVLDPESRS